MLHLVNKSPNQSDALSSCLRLAKQQSEVLLIEDAVYAAMADAETAKILHERQQDIQFYVLEPDLLARGINDKPLVDGVIRVDYSEFVDLTIKHDRVQSWL